MNGRIGRIALITVAWGMFLLMLVNSRPIDQYMDEVQHVSKQTRQDEELRRQIIEYKQKLDQSPISARLDQVWKAIPGYNGRSVDVEASLQQMKRLGQFEPKQLVFQETPPAVTLEQLGAEPIYRGNPQKPAVSFMVNVAWGNEYLDKMLDTFARYEVKTTFFLDGSWVNKYPELAFKIYTYGHEIGNHAYSHPDMGRIGTERIRQELQKTQDVIEKTIGFRPELFAPPSGAFSDQVVQIARDEFQMKTILWTVDTVDWRKPPVQQMVKKITDKLDNGVLVLMHPTQSASEGLEQMIVAAQKRGLTITTVSEVISSKRIDE